MTFDVLERESAPAATEPSFEMPANRKAAVPGKVTPAEAMALARHCMRYRDPNDVRAWHELATTFGLYSLTCAAMLWALASGIWSGIALAVPAGLLLVRLFTVQHDCGHGSFFSSRTLNTWVGRVLGVLTVTPFGAWKLAHSLHHSGSGDLERRGIGDIDTLTVKEYEARSVYGRWAYRAYRHPIVLHLIGPPIYFLVVHRIPFFQALPSSQVWKSTMATNAGIVALYGSLGLLVGFGPVLAAVVAVATVASWIGGWLFYVQHQFEETHWAAGEDWDARTAALNGSSHYVLPGWLHWLTGHIGLHHIHHLNSRVPSYRLPECLAGDERLSRISRLTMRESLGSIGLSLWDEETRRLVPFAQA